MSMRNRFGSFQNTPFKFFTPGRSFRNRNKNTNNNNNAVKAGSNDTRRDGRSNRSNQQRQASQPQSLSQERLPPGQDSTTVIGSIFDSLVELDCLKNFHLTSIILGPFRYLTNFFGILPLTKQMQYSAILFAISFFIFYNNLPGGQSTPPPQSPQSPHQSLSSRNGQIKKRGGRNVPSSSSSSSLSIFRFIILLISLVTMIFSLFIFISALIKVILNYFNNNEEDLLLPHPHLSQQQQNGMRQSSSSYLSEMEMPINMANSNKQRLHRHHHNTQQQRYSSSSQQNAHLIHNHNHNHNLGGYDRLGRPNDIYYAPTGDQYERLLTVPEMRRMQQQRAAASGGGAGIVGSSTYHEQKEFEEHTGLGSHGRRNLQSLSPNRKLALDPHATVDRESMERELNKDAVKLDIINQQFGRVSPPKLRQQRSQYSSNSNVTGGGGDLNSSTGASGVLNSPQNSYSRSRSKTRSPRLAFMNFGDSARSSGIGGISGVGGMSVVSGTTGAGSRGSRGSRIRGVPSVAETDLAIAKTMAELRQEATPISRVLGGMKFTPAPHNLHNMDLLATPMNRKYGHGHGHHGRSRTPTGTKSRLHMHNNMNRIDENPAPMSIDKSLISGVGASGGSTMSRRSKDDSFVINRRFIAPTNLKNQYFPQQNQQQHRQMMNNNNNNSNNMNDINRQRAQYDAMLNDRGMYGNVNLRMNRIDPNAPASLAVQQQRQQQLEQQQRLQMQQQQGLISPFDGKFEQRMPLSPFSRQTELDQMKKQSHESRFMQKYGIGSSRSTGSGKYVGNSGSQHRSDFIAEYLERSSKLYENLDIDTQIHHWSSNMRWWMSDKLKEKHNNWCQNNKHIDELFVHLNQWFPNNRQQFTQFSATLEKKVEFVLTNEGKLGEISRQRNAPLIQSIVATRKSIKDNADKIDPNTKYIFQRLTEFCDSTNLNEFQWNSGGTISREHGWRADLYPTDGELLFGIFREYMDAIFCPGFKFSDKHFIGGCKQDEMNEFKYFGRYFKDVAIVEVLPNVIRRSERENDKNNSRDNYTSFNRDRLKRERERDRRRQLLQSNTNNNFDDTTGDLPYYFIIYDKEKFDESIKDFIQTNQENIANNRNLNGIRKPKAYLSSKGGKHDRRRNKSDSFEDDYYGKKKRKYDSVRRRNASSNSSSNGNIPARKDYVSKVSAWYPIPGKDNVFHCLVLLAFFLQRFNNSELRGVKLKDRNCDLLTPLQR